MNGVNRFFMAVTVSAYCFVAGLIFYGVAEGEGWTPAQSAAYLAAAVSCGLAGWYVGDVSSIARIHRVGLRMAVRLWWRYLRGRDTTALLLGRER